MNILMVAPESVPFVKVGGLADAVGSLAQDQNRTKVNEKETQRK
jgi:glycogen synthase